ncbi:MAG TPA: hypothetical protein VGI10_01245 [Polyangiaceae bacterium]|jgi:hypothetical protein
MRTFARLLNFTLCAAAVTLLTNSAVAKEPTAAERKAASDSFKSCHEQEKYGEATTCWRVWYDKYQTIGGEAEVLYAQEKLKHAGVALPAPRSDEKPAPETKPAPLPPTPKTPEPKPEKKSKKTEEPPPEPKPIEVKPSEEPKADQTPAPGADAAAMVVPAAVAVSGPNICEMQPDPNAKGFSRKRVVIFSFADAESIETDPAIKTAGGAHHLREVFIERFPLERFANVVTTFSGLSGWEGTPQLTKDLIKQRITSARTDENGAALDRLSQSIDCADYVVFPTVTAHTVKPVAAQTKNGQAIPAGVELTLSAKLGIFKASNDGFSRVATLETNVPTFFDRGIEAAASASAGAMSGATGALDSANKTANQVKNAPGQLEKMGDQVKNAAGQAGDAAGNLANGQMPGGLGTSGGSDSSPDAKPADAPLLANPMGGLHERLSDRCTKPKSSDDVVACEVRVRGYQAAMHFREDSASVEGWQLSAPLKYINGDQAAPGISLGREEALKVGNRFVVVGPDGKRQAYYKVTSVGPGGSGGEADPSKLALRLGDAPEGSELREYRKIGLEIEVHGSVGVFLLNPAAQYLYDPLLPTFTDDPSRRAGDCPTGSSCFFAAGYADPKIGFGGGGSIGYDLSSLLSVNELHVRVGAEYLTGTGTGVSANIIATDLTFEKGFYVGKGLGFYLGVGPSFSLLKETIAVPTDPSSQTLYGPSIELDDKRVGANGQLGFDILFSPSVTLRIGGVFRYNFGSDLKYQGVPAGDTIWQTQSVKEPYANGVGRLGLIYTL